MAPRFDPLRSRGKGGNFYVYNLNFAGRRLFSVEMFPFFIRFFSPQILKQKVGTRMARLDLEVPKELKEETSEHGAEQKRPEHM